MIVSMFYNKCKCFSAQLDNLKTFILSFSFGMEWWGGRDLKDFFLKLINLVIVWYYTNPQSFLLPGTGQKDCAGWLVVVVVVGV